MECPNCGEEIVSALEVVTCYECGKSYCVYCASKCKCGARGYERKDDEDDVWF
jgi:hypothetical protein